MLAPPSGLLRAGLALKLSQIKLAMRSYLRDRTQQATGTLASHAIAAGLFAAAGIFLIAACLVGITALFRWIEINYGLFWAFGVTGALLLAVAAILASLATTRLRRRTPHFPSLTSRLRVAIRANPIQSDRIDAVRDTAAAILQSPAEPLTGANRRRPKTGPRPARNSRDVGAGLIVAATLLGWAATRRRQQSRRTKA